MVYRKEVFENLKFDENLYSYALAEDFDFSYRVYKKFPKGVFITPGAKLIHRAAEAGRLPTAKLSYMNQINHFYLNFKNFNNTTLEKFGFVWTLTGISFLRTLKFLTTLKKEDSLKLKLFFNSSIFCLKNLKKVKSGKLKELMRSLGFV